MKFKNGFIGLILLGLIVVIWYYNILLIKKLPPQQNQPAFSSLTPLSIESLPEYNFVYRDIKRDPFNVIIDTTPKEPVKPVFTLKGVVLSQNESSALMEVFGETYLMKKGEAYLGVKIKEVTPKSVIIEYRGKKEILRLWE